MRREATVRTGSFQAFQTFQLVQSLLAGLPHFIGENLVDEGLIRHGFFSAVLRSHL